MNPLDPVEKAFPRLRPDQKRALVKLRVRTLRDLLYHFPARYENAGPTGTVSALTPGSDVTLYGTIRKPETKKAWKSRRPMAQAYLEDASGKVKLVWFSQPYIAKTLSDGMVVKIRGRVAGGEGKVYVANPEVERSSIDPEAVHQTLFHEAPETDPAAHTLHPVYPESQGVSSLWFQHNVRKLFEARVHEQLADPIPPDMLARYKLPTLSSALVFMHAPKKREDAEAAKKRFAFEEIFLLQLALQEQRRLAEKERALPVTINREALASFVRSFPFPPTKAQERAIETIVHDFEQSRPMLRLLEGDVGSGKTAVAAATAYLVATSRPPGRIAGTLQVAYLCPTEILAKQHFSTFVSYFKDHPIPIGLVTGSECRKFPSRVPYQESAHLSKAAFKKMVAGGEIPIVIGTHALIEKSLAFKHLAYAIIDEQHRFGVVHRSKLVNRSGAESERGKKDSDARRGKRANEDVSRHTAERANGTRNAADEPFGHAPAPHLLSMTATPIPRTLALTIYGDLDLSLLDEMPAGRKPVKTEVLGPEKREAAYERVRTELAAGRQAYVICPRIDEPDPEKELALQAKSVKAEAERLKKDVFPKVAIGILHSKMRPHEKESAMNAFARGETEILVATSVVEVGVNVPNATVILIEGAERFGLAQLHQLRGRVIRSSHQAYCFALPESFGEATKERMKAFTGAKNGFELAEYDLALRGAGALTGGKQWGVSDIAMEALKNVRLVEAARAEAAQLIASDPGLTQHPELSARAYSALANLHLE